MGRLLKFLIVLIILAFAGLVGFAYFGDLTPERRDVSEPVELDAN